MNFYVFSWPYRDVGPYYYPPDFENIARLERTYPKLLWVTGMTREEVPCTSRHSGARLRRFMPLRVRPKRPRPLAAIEWTVYSECLISAELYQRFQAHKFSGLDFEPATIETSSGRAMQYFEMKASQIGGELEEKSGVRVIESCEMCGYVKVQDGPGPLPISPASWTGLDFFVVREYPHLVFVSQRVAEIAAQEGWQSCALTRSELYNPKHGAEWWKWVKDPSEYPRG